jgi:hypothetical protein
MALAGHKLVDPPTFKHIRFGLFSVAEPRDANDSGWATGGITFDNLIGCGPVGTAVQPCNTPVSKSVFLTPEYPTGDAFTAYALSRCAGPTFFNQGKDSAVQALDFNEERSVEKALMTELLADATDKTPSTGPVTAAQGIALLEGLWGQYGGAFEPTFHLDRTIAHLGWGALDRHGSHLETELGSQVAAGAGYFDPAYDEAAGTSWVVATGPLVIFRGVMQAHDPVFVGGSADTDNTWVALAERSFAWAYPCTALKVEVNSLSGIDGGGA